MAIIGIGTYQALSEGMYSALIALAFALIAFVGTFLGISYTIEEDRLTVCNLFFIRQTYDLKKLISITPTRNPISSPAASLRRISLNFGCGSPLIISPASQAMFIEEILRINPNVQVEA